jgi:hypothetical protein
MEGGERGDHGEVLTRGRSWTETTGFWPAAGGQRRPARPPVVATLRERPATMSERLLARKAVLGTWGVEDQALGTRRTGSSSVQPWRLAETV